VTATRAGAVTAGAGPSSKRLAGRVAGGSVVAMGATALGCAAFGVLGGVPAIVGVLVAGPLYAAGHLTARALHRRRARNSVAPVAADDDAATLASLDELMTAIHGRVPSTVESRVQRVARTVRQTIPRLDQLGPGSAQAHSVLRTATSYLPEAVAAYMRLPRDFADRRAVSGGKTSLTILCDQLDLLGSKMDDVFDAACRADADALIAHGCFLAEKFSSGAIALDPQKR